ncbi:MAG: site-specific DNA-methyltransferase [Planctomycetales bacterium]|nr:site-specific DNA-methyltransferase [Planctomycetales bacterium]
MEKLDPKIHGQSSDLLAENVAQLRRIFPDAFSEGRVDFEVLRELLGDYAEEQQERYGLSWSGKGRARQIAQTPSNGTLRPAPDESVSWDRTKNAVIEGDNLEVLKLLQKSYHRRVKMIYIDPPYNTGNEFIYPDRYQDNLDTYLRYTGQVDSAGLKLTANAETQGRYHTNWLNMIYPRLKLARNLLRDDGVIFISIDDHEVQNLRHLMDEIFGPENFVATIIWQKMYAPKSSAKHFSEDHDYIVVYARDAGHWRPELLPRTAEQDAAYKNLDNDPRGLWRPNNLAARNYYSKGTYSITCPGGRTIAGPPSGSYWRISEQKFRELDADGRIWWGEDGNNVPAPKIFLTEVKQGRVPQTLWKWREVGHNQEAKKMLLERISFESSDSVFDTPKPPRLIQQMLRIGTHADEEALVLDFFAGSGTTGDAVMQLNAEDGGNRRFLLVQFPEKTGATDFATIAEITKARLRSAAEAIREQLKADLPETDRSIGCDLGFRVWKLGSSNIKAWEGSSESLEPNLLASVDNIKHDRSDDDVLYELLLKYGLDLSLQIEERDIEGKRVFILGAGALVVCLSPNVSLSAVEAIGNLKSELEPAVMRVVFRDASFKDDVVKANAVQILKRAGISDIKSL